MKQTTKSIIPEDWQQKSFSECVEKTSIPRQIKIPQGQYQKAGEYPIVDQGADFIAGYTNDKSKLYSGRLPVIVFGDHTRIFKYVDFAFSLGADGTKLLCPKEFLNPQYFYYYLCGLALESKGYNRHYKYLKEKVISFPEIVEQRRIAHILLSIKNATNQQEKTIAKTKELKRSLMHRLFTYGLRGEELKETEIGNIPKSWGIKRINEFAKVKYGKQKPKAIGSIPVIGSSGIYARCKSSLISFPTLVVGRKGTAGAVHLFVEPCWPSDTTFYLEWISNKLNINFLYYYMSTNLLSGEHAKTTLPSIQRQDLERYTFPYPSRDEQIEIVNIIDEVNEKLSNSESQKQVTQSLFRAMLNNLMTGQVRVKDIDFEGVARE